MAITGQAGRKESINPVVSAAFFEIQLNGVAVYGKFYMLIIIVKEYVEISRIK
ncbi:hypothetical protein [Propionispora sp. 2/2-37]|uniref:hypothetical protein n=1 Tax=Propionispora sp. 2/2-37 TaxID=1677858 RepID=UPI0012E22BE8|nr:hypothetical protein [Propionispora sp. 2/2-37]